MPNSSEDLINLLITRREKLKLTQNKISNKAGVSHTSIARMETGEQNPTLSLFIAVANQLGYDLVLQEISSENGSNEFGIAIDKAGYKVISNTDGVFSDDVLVLRKKNPGVGK